MFGIAGDHMGLLGKSEAADFARRCFFDGSGTLFRFSRGKVACFVSDNVAIELNSRAALLKAQWFEYGGVTITAAPHSSLCIHSLRREQCRERHNAEAARVASSPAVREERKS